MSSLRFLSKSRCPKLTQSQRSGGILVSVCLPHLLPPPQPCHQCTKKSASKIQIKKPVHLTMHTPGYQKCLSLLHLAAAGRATFPSTEQQVHHAPREAAAAFSEGGDRPTRSSSDGDTLEAHNSLVSNSSQSHRHTSPTCKNKLSSKTAAQTLQKLAQNHPST